MTRWPDHPMTRFSPSLRPERGRRLAQNLLPHLFTHGQSLELLQIPLNVRNAWTRPVGAKQRLVRNLIQPRKILQQHLRRDAADIEMYIRMSPYEKKRGVHPQRTPAVGQQNLQPGEIDRHIVNIDRVAIL